MKNRIKSGAILMALPLLLSACAPATTSGGSAASSEPTSSSTSSLTSSDLTSVLISSNSVLSEAVSSVAEISSMVTSSKAVVSSKPTASSKVTVSSKPTTTAKKPPASSKATVSSKPAAPANPWDRICTTSDEDMKLVAERVIYWINYYRREEGATHDAVPLPKMTKYAELRAKQLVTNFAHDRDDEEAAAAALQYGDYNPNPTYLDGSPAPPFWDAPVGEAIALGIGPTGQNSIDRVGHMVAVHVKGSAPHWGYVGDKDLIYITVGCAVNAKTEPEYNGRLYTCICTDLYDPTGLYPDASTYE